MITILEPGARTTIQDLGRPHAAPLGVPPSGAFDPLGALAANAIVGNDPSAALLEATLHGPTFRIDRACVLAVVGGGFSPTIDGAPFPLATPIEAPSGATIAIGRRGDGVRCAIAFRGGLDTGVAFESHAQLLTGGIGAPELSPGTVLALGDAARHAPRARALPSLAPTLRVITREPDFSIEEWTVDVRADRTGVRCVPARGPRSDGGSSDPEPMPVGAIQLPPDGIPIILGPDGPVTGGYRLIGVLARADLSVLAQSPPGRRLAVRPLSVEDAARAWQDATHAWTS